MTPDRAVKLCSILDHIVMKLTGSNYKKIYDFYTKIPSDLNVNKML